MNHTQESVLTAADRLVQAFGSHDTAAYFSAFSADASFIFHSLDRVLKSRADYEAEWALWETRDGFRVLGCRSSDRTVQVTGDIAVFTHTVETDISTGGDPITHHERETIVFRRDETAHWLAFHEHLSAMPG